MIEDYIKYSNLNLNESKVLTNSIGAVLYISKEWDINKDKIMGNKDLDEIENKISQDNKERKKVGIKRKTNMKKKVKKTFF